MERTNRTARWGTLLLAAGLTLVFFVPAAAATHTQDPAGWLADNCERINPDPSTCENAELGGYCGGYVDVYCWPRRGEWCLLWTFYWCEIPL